jgi:hypothetical protein
VRRHEERCQFEFYLADRIDRWEARRRLATTRPSEAHTPKSITRTPLRKSPCPRGLDERFTSAAHAAALGRRQQRATHRRMRRNARTRRDGRWRWARRCVEGTTSRASVSRTRSNEANLGAFLTPAGTPAANEGTGDAHALHYTRPPTRLNRRFVPALDKPLPSRAAHAHGVGNLRRYYTNGR